MPPLRPYPYTIAGPVSRNESIRPGQPATTRLRSAGPWKLLPFRANGNNSCLRLRRWPPQSGKSPRTLPRNPNENPGGDHRGFQQLLPPVPDPDTLAIAPGAHTAMAPIATANPSPHTPPAPPGVSARMPRPMADRLQFRLGVAVLEDFFILRLEFVEDTASGGWNAGHCVDGPNRARESRRPCNAKHSCQK